MFVAKMLVAKMHVAKGPRTMPENYETSYSLFHWASRSNHLSLSTEKASLPLSGYPARPSSTIDILQDNAYPLPDLPHLLSLYVGQ